MPRFSCSQFSFTTTHLRPGCVPLVIYWPLLQSLNRYYGSHFSSQPSLVSRVGSYGWFFNLPPTLGFGLAIFSLVAILVFGLLRYRGLTTDDHPEIPIQESVLALGLLFLPAIMYLVARILHGGFNPRYLLLTVLAFPMVAGHILASLDRRLVGLFAIFLFVSLGVQEGAFWRAEVHSLGKKVSPAVGVEQLMDAAGHGDLPVIVSDALDYLQLVHYASTPKSLRLAYLADVPAAITYAGTDSADKNLLALQAYLGLHVYDFSEFSKNHREFLVYSNSRPKWDWWPTRLLHDGYTLELVAMDQEKRIYLVRQPR